MIKIDYDKKKARIRGWTKDQDDFLIKTYDNNEFTIQEIGEAIGKSERTVRTRAAFLGLKSNRKHNPFDIDGMKLCPRCKEHLPYNMFVKNSSKLNGIGSYCISCDKLIKRERQERIKKEKKLINRKELKEKKCTRCKEVKSIDEFYTSGGMCKKCRNERNKEIDFEMLKKRGYIN